MRPRRRSGHWPGRGKIPDAGRGQRLRLCCRRRRSDDLRPAAQRAHSHGAGIGEPFARHRQDDQSERRGDGSGERSSAHVHLGSQSVPPGATLPIFSVNGTTSSNNTMATFYQAGTYTFTCTIADPTDNGSITSSVNVTVNQTLTSGLATLSPSTVTVVNGGSFQFVGGGTDQFGNSMPGPATWSVLAGGAAERSTPMAFTRPLPLPPAAIL